MDVLPGHPAATIHGVANHRAHSRISEVDGHSSVNPELDRYGDLLPGSAQVALGRLREFLAKKQA